MVWKTFVDSPVRLAHWTKRTPLGREKELESSVETTWVAVVFPGTDALPPWTLNCAPEEAEEAETMLLTNSVPVELGPTRDASYPVSD